jgi:hypothetical protein
MKAVLTREKRGHSRTITGRFGTVCLGLLLTPILSGVALSASPEFFSVDGEKRLERTSEQALWMAPSSCSGTCFHGPVRLTSEVTPVSSAQNHFGQFAVAHNPTAQREQSVAPSPERPSDASLGRATTSRQVPHVGSAQNRFGYFYGAPHAAVRVPQNASVVPNRTADRVNHQQTPTRSVYGLNSAQTPLGQQALGYQTTVRLVQNVDELQPVDANQERASGEESVSDAESLGAEPENVGIQFLRAQTVLLKPCQWQFDVGLAYTIAENDFPTVVNGNVITEGRIRQRLLVVPFEARYGLTSRIQLFASTPVGYSNTERVIVGFDDEFTDTGGIGDISFGLSAQLVPGSACRPELIGTLGVTAPTGDASIATSFLTPEAALGEGFWGFTGNLLWVRNYDPVVVYYGVGANFRLDNELGGFDVDPGDRFLYQLGVGFAVNRHVTLSTAFIGSYWVQDHLNGIPVPGGVREPLRLRFAATIGKSCRLIEPFAELGMTEDAPSSRIGITWTF